MYVRRSGHLAGRDNTGSRADAIAASDQMTGDTQGTFTVTPEQEGCVVICDADGAELSNGYGAAWRCGAWGTAIRWSTVCRWNGICRTSFRVKCRHPMNPEALKAQAVCARSYACIQLLQGDLAEYGAHIDDSTAYQVYNRVTDADAAREAVIATQGKCCPIRETSWRRIIFHVDGIHRRSRCVECGRSGGIRLSDTGVSPYGWKDAGSLRGGGVFLLIFRVPQMDTTVTAGISAGERRRITMGKQMK